MAPTGVIIAGLSSSSGKTLTSLGLLRALKQHGHDVAAAKTGPDYIDPGFHHAALSLDPESPHPPKISTASVNLDGFAMSPEILRHLAASQSGDLLIIEGVMGLYDGGAGSAVTLAKHLGVPIILVMDCRGQAETSAEIAAALKHRLAADGVDLAGVILNRVSTARHGDGIKAHCQECGLSVLGILPNQPDIDMPSRHLGLVQAFDLAAAGQLNTLLDQAAAMMKEGVDLNAVINTAQPLMKAQSPSEALPPPGQKIAVAYDAAFGFAYHHLLEGWRRQGAEVQPFSPLADEMPMADADFIFLPGGYPELHLEVLTHAARFKKGMGDAAQNNTPIYGECGGYMVLGQGITNQKGETIPMLGLLDLVTSFTAPKRVLGYRQFTQRNNALPFWPQRLYGHEFHFTTATKAEGTPLFDAKDKQGRALEAMGLVKGKIAGSYGHIIAGG